MPRPTLVGPDVELVGGQVRHALALREAVHREQLAPAGTGHEDALMCASDNAAAVLVMIRSDRRSKDPRFESAISIENIVGTPGKTVTRSRAIASSTLTGKGEVPLDHDGCARP